MPRFDVDFGSVDGTIPTYPKARYQLKVTNGKPFVRLNRKDEQIAGVRYSFQMIGVYNPKGQLDRADEGRSVSTYTVWVHTKGGWQFAKPFMIAGLGYTRQEEAACDEKWFTQDAFKAGDWSVNGEVDAADPPTMGKGFEEIIGTILDVNLDIDVQETEDRTYENQEFSGWSPPAKPSKK